MSLLSSLESDTRGGRGLSSRALVRLRLRHPLA